MSYKSRVRSVLGILDPSHILTRQPFSTTTPLFIALAHALLMHHPFAAYSTNKRRSPRIHLHICRIASYGRHWEGMRK